MLNAQWTCITYGGVICPCRTSPGRWAQCSCKKVARISQYRCYPILTSQYLLLEPFFVHFAKQGSWYIDLELAAIIAKALNSISVSEAPPQTTSARRHVAWALLALVYSAQARTAVSIFKNVYARDPGFFNGRLTRTFLSMLLRHRQFRGAAEIAKLSPRLRWRRFVLLGLARRGSTPRVEAQLGATLLPKWLVDVVAHTRLGRRHPAAGLLRRWATRRTRTLADTRNGFKLLVRARGVASSDACVSDCTYVTQRRGANRVGEHHP